MVLVVVFVVDVLLVDVVDDVVGHVHVIPLRTGSPSLQVGGGK